MNTAHAIDIMGRGGVGRGLDGCWIGLLISHYGPMLIPVIHMWFISIRGRGVGWDQLHPLSPPPLTFLSQESIWFEFVFSFIAWHEHEANPFCRYILYFSVLLAFFNFIHWSWFSGLWHVSNILWNRNYKCQAFWIISYWIQQKQGKSRKKLLYDSMFVSDK